MGWTVRVLILGRDKRLFIFYSLSASALWPPHSLLLSVSRGVFLRRKVAGAWSSPVTSIRCRVWEWAKLQLLVVCKPLWQCSPDGLSRANRTFTGSGLIAPWYADQSISPLSVTGHFNLILTVVWTFVTRVWRRNFSLLNHIILDAFRAKHRW